MRSVKIEHGVNWVPLSMKYTHDEDIKFRENNVHAKEGMSLTLCSALSSAIDMKINNYSQIMLTDAVRANTMLGFDIRAERYPENITTYLLANGHPSLSPDSKYIKIIENESDSIYRDHFLGQTTINGQQYDSWYFSQDVDDNSMYFTVTLHSESEISINHNDNYMSVYMSVSGDPGSGTSKIYFSASDLNVPQEHQKLNYIYERESGNLILYKIIGGQTYYVKSKQNELVLEANTEDSFPLSSVIKVNPIKKNTYDMTLNNNWVSYLPDGDFNRLDVNENRSYKDIYNNYMLTTQYTNITGDCIDVDITLLKNQLSPTYNSTRGNPFINIQGCDHRQYDKIFSGTNQVKGPDDICLGYNSYEAEVVLPPDQVTYFHTPQDMYPYNKINVNDSGLCAAGAIGGDTPSVADKIFKKAADYRYSSPDGSPIDEQTGVWLCSWLKSDTSPTWSPREVYNENVTVLYDDNIYRAIESNSDQRPDKSPDSWEKTDRRGPVWLDRYYNPDKYSVLEALEIPDQYTEYTDKFTYITKNLGAEDTYVFDKLSDLTFQPGSRYAYYRVGPKENMTTIESIPDKIHEGYAPSFDDSGVVFENPLEDRYIFTGETYIETERPANITNSDFTASLSLDMVDWTRPIGTQIAGNYINAGVGLFNKLHVTPYITVPGLSSTCIYNTDMNLVLSLPTSGSHVLPGFINENVHIVSRDDSGDNKLYQYDKKGSLIETTEINTVSGIHDISYDDNSIYVYYNTGLMRKYDIDSEEVDLLNQASPKFVLGTPSHLTNISNHMFVDSGRNYIIPWRDQQYRINCDHYTIDMEGDVWFTKGNRVYRYTASDKRGQNATFREVIDNRLVSLIAEESESGSVGNSISLTGDGVSTISTLIANWNQLNPYNRLRSLTDTGNLVVLESGKILTLTGGTDRGQAVTTIALSANGDISGIKCDDQNNTWIVAKGNKNKLFKIDNVRNKLIDVDINHDILSQPLSGHTNFYLDILSEFEDANYNNTVVLLSNDDDIISGNVGYTRIAGNGNVLSSVLKEVPDLTGQRLSELKNITNYETSKNTFIDTINTNHLIFKMRLQSYFDSDKTYTTTLKYNVENLTPGSHHVAFQFNSLTGYSVLFVDGRVVDLSPSRDLMTGAAYKFTNTIHAPIIIGAEPHFNNTLMSEFVSKSNYMYLSGGSVSDIRIYNTCAGFNKIRALARERKIYQPLTLTLPAGKRSYIDQATKFYKHRVPGRKSEVVDIDIVSQNLSSSEVQVELESTIRNNIRDVLPANTSLNNINWIT